MKTSTLSNFLAVLVLGALLLGTSLPAYASDPVTPIPPGPETSLPEFIGEAGGVQPLPNTRVPQNPFLAPNPFSFVHNDTWASDVYDIAGPLGEEPEVLSNRMAEARLDPDSKVFQCCGAVDSHGRPMLSYTGPGEWSLVLVDPVSLEVLAYKLMPPPETLLMALSTAYVYLDNHDRLFAMVRERDPNTNEVQNKIQVMQIVGSPGDLSFDVVHEYDVSAYVDEGDKINGLLPDWQGRIWFVVRDSGLLGVVDPDTGSVQHTHLEGSITNSFAMDRDAAYIVTTEKMYRIELDSDGIPQVVWEEGYQNIDQTKPGQLSAGSGTTPTILGNGKYVAITDNAEQMHVTVFRTERKLDPNEKRIVCEVEVFEPGAGADENSLVGLGLSLIAYNAYGYDLPTIFAMKKSLPSEPGIARVDIDPNGKGCRLVWENDTVSLTDSTAKMSTRSGLIYAVTRKYDTEAPGYEDPGLDVYYFSAIDFRTGSVVWERLLGTGFGYDNFSAVIIGPTGTAYIPGYGGIVAVRDTK